MSHEQRPSLGPEGERLFASMVRWRALATTCIFMGFAAGFVELIVANTGGGDQLTQGLAGLALLLIAAAAVSVVIGYVARRRFLAWYRQNGPD